MFGEPSALGSPLRWGVIKDARRRQLRRRGRNALVALALTVVAAFSALLIGRSVDRAPNAHVASSSAVNVGGLVLDTASTRDRVWVLVCVQSCQRANTGKDQDQLVEINATTHDVLRRLPLTNAIAIAAGGGSVWVAHFLDGDVSRVDPRTGRTTATVQLRLPSPIITHAGAVERRDWTFLPSAVAYSQGCVWISTARGWVAKVDGRTGKLVSMVASPSEATSTTTDRRGTWVAEDLDGVGLLRPNGRRLTIRSIRWKGQPVDVATLKRGGGFIWAVGQIIDPGTGPTTTVVTTINPSTSRIVFQRQLPATEGAAFASGALYLGDLKHARMYRLAGNGTIQALTSPPGDGILETATAGTLWATTTTAPEQLEAIGLARPLPIRG
jgi:hypothetical protein